ncbi:MAG: FecR domain-containing protein [Bacteroidota bacterium]
MKEDHYILLLQKQLAGDISNDEQSQLDLWLADSEANQRIAVSVKKAWHLSAGFTSDVDLDLDADFQKIETRLNTEKQDAKIRPLLHRRWVLRLAAAVLLLVVGRFVLKKYLTPAVQYQVVNTAEKPSAKPIELLDGSKVWLNANSRLTYFTTAVSNERTVKLEGEAFFDVARDASKPFVVELPTGAVKVLGTSFTALENEDNIEVTVSTGTVRLTPIGSEKSVTMTANQKGVFDKKAGQLSVVESAGLNELAWHTQKLVFDETPLKKVVVRLEEFYETQIEIENTALENCPVTATFDNKTIKVVVETLDTILGTSSSKTVEGGYILKGGQCQ